MSNTIDLARKLAEYGEKEEARRAYALVLQEAAEQNPEVEMEAAGYLFFSRGNYQTAYTAFVSLYNRGHFRPELMELMTQAFYLPNVKAQKRRYRENCERLSRYPYLFQKDFPPFEDLPVRFFPFNDRGFVPYYRAEDRFGPYVDFNDPVIDRYFFKDLDQPVLAEEVYSQYQLEYLNDTVRKSEWVGYENHIYLHYADFSLFCAHLQCLEWKELLRDKKFVLLMGEERGEYPIDFQARFGIDYAKYPPKPLGIREINRLIWHTQLASHNGGDFFNEILYGHPNLLAIESIMFDKICEVVRETREALAQKNYRNNIVRSLARIDHPTDKDILAAVFLGQGHQSNDPAARIAPALLFQPHFKNMLHDVNVVNERKGWTTLSSKQYEQIRTSPIFQGFKYIKTFTPIRRVTTSFAATTRFMVDCPAKSEEEKESLGVLPDLINVRMLNRSYLIDPWDRLYRDSVLVRFEDGKLNPRATFTALAEFLDIPYTESMTYCSGISGLNPESLKGNALGFDPSTVYKTYDEYAGDAERAFLEFFFRDVYAACGYDFQYYKGEAVDEDWIREKISGFTVTNDLTAASWRRVLKAGFHLKALEHSEEQMKDLVKTFDDDIENNIHKILGKYDRDRLNFARCLLQGLRFINRQGQPLRPMPLLKLDPALLERPLYH